MGQKGPKAKPMAGLFKMKYQGKGGAAGLMKTLVGDQHKLPDHLKKAIKDAPGKSYGSKSKALMKKDPDKDEFGNPIPKDFKDSRTGKGKEEVGGKADSYETLEKKIINAAKKDKTRDRASATSNLRQTAKGGTATGGMSKAERNRMERNITGASEAHKEGAVQTYERLKNLRRKRGKAVSGYQGKGK